MAWKTDVAKKSDILDLILHDYRKISEAPLDVLEENKAYERTKKYKSINSQTGNIYLIRNPAAREIFYDDEGRKHFIHFNPEFVMTYDQAKKASEGKPITGKGSGQADIQF